MAKKKLTARKKPRQERSVATVEAILQAATYILTKRGWDTFTTNEVARKAGVNVASLYQYFPNKESIVAELQRRHVRGLKQRWPDPPRNLSIPEYVRVMLDAVVSEHRANPPLHRVFADELPRANRVGSPQRASQVRWAERDRDQTADHEGARRSTSRHGGRTRQCFQPFRESDQCLRVPLAVREQVAPCRFPLLEGHRVRLEK